MIVWEPEVLARIRHLTLKARHAVEGVLQGAHRSRALGPAVEFVDFKEYSPGDPLRDLDWRVLARSDRLVGRRYQAESDLPATLLLDASADMATGVGSLGAGRPRPPLDGSKFGYALCLTATLAWYLQLRNEPVGLTVLGGEGLPWRVLPPRAGRRHLSRILAVLASVSPAGRAGLGKGLRAAAERQRRSSLLVLVSDLMEETETWAPALQALGQRRTDLRVLQLWDRGELQLRYPRSARFFSPEGGPAQPLDPVAARPAFLQVVAQWQQEVRRAVQAWRGIHLRVPTDRPLAEPLWRLLCAGRTAARRSSGSPP